MEILDLPCVGIHTDRFDPVRPSSLNRMEGRRTERRSFGTAYWHADYTAPSGRLPAMGEMDSFLMALENGAVFRAYDTSRQRPIAYAGAPLSGSRAGGGAFDGTAALDQIVDARTVVVSTLPAGFQLRAGDYLGIEKSASEVSLHRVTADVAANGSGEATIAILHPLDTGIFTTADTVRLEGPFCLMQCTGFSAGRRRMDRQIAFSAEEVFFYEVET